MFANIEVNLSQQSINSWKCWYVFDFVFNWTQTLLQIFK